MKVVKRVAFYDTVVDVTDVNGNESTKRVGPNFWPKLMDKLESLDYKRRSQTISRVRYYGKIVLPKSPAVRHLQVGRLRDISEHLEQTNIASGDVSPLLLPDPNLRVSEPTFVVPFGKKGRIAVISPGRQTRYETVGHWLTAVLNYAPKGKSIRFIPVIDTDVLAKLLAAQGAVGIEFNFDADKSLSGAGSKILDAVDDLRSEGPSTGTVTVGWSLGFTGGTQHDRDLLQKVAQTIVNKKLAKRASANLVVTDEDGNIRREQHDLIADKVVTQVRYEVDADAQQTPESILTSVDNAIKKFTKQQVAQSDGDGDGGKG